MSMSRKARIWLSILSLPIVLVIAGGIVLKLVLTGDRLKSMVIPRVEEATGRTVAVNQISLSVFPSLSLNMEGVSMSNRPGFSADPFLTIEALRLHVKLFPLLKSRVDVTSLELDRPHLLLEINKRNETNYGDPGGKEKATPQGPGTPEPSPSAGKAPPPAAAFLISNLLVDRAAIDYVNHRENSATRVANLFLTMDVGGEGSIIIITGTAATDSLSYGTVETPLLSGLRLRLDHRVSYDLSNDHLSIDKGEITVQDMRLMLSGSVSRLRSDTRLDLSVGSDSLNIADLLSLVPRVYLKKAEGIEGNGTAQVHITVTGTLTDSTSADVAGTISARGASIRYPQLPKPITDIAVTSRFIRTKSRQAFSIDNLTANLGGTPLRMSMTVEKFDDPSFALSASGSLNLATLSEYYPLERGTELGGEVTLDLRIAGRISVPKTLKASGSVSLRDVSAKTAATTNPVRKLNGIIGFSNEVIDSKKLSLTMGESDMTLAFRLRNYLSLVSTDTKAPQSTASMTLQSNHLFVHDITGDKPASASAAEKPTSPAEGTTGGQKSGPPGKPGPASGKSPFPFPSLEMDIVATIGRLTFEKFECTNVRGSMHVGKGLVTMQSLSLNAFGGSVVSNGTLDLSRPDRSPFDLDLSLNALEASSLLPLFTSFGQRLSGALTMRTSLKGALDDTLGLVPDGLQGGGKVAVKNGSLKGFRINQTLARQLNLPDLETIQFKDWGNDFTIENGRFVVKDLTITGLNAQYVVNGSQGLDGSLDYRMALYLPESAAPKLKIAGLGGEAVNLFKDQSGRLRLDFTVGGTTDDPRVQLNTEPVRKRAEDLAKQKLDEERKKLEENLKEKVGDAFKDLFKKGKGK